MAVLVRNNLVVSVINSHRPLTTTESANNGTRYEVNDGVDIHIGGTVTLTDGKVSDITNPNALTTTEERRERVKEWLRAGEDQPVANWGLLSDAKAKQYWIWLEMVGRASADDGNMTNATRWGKIEDEIEISHVEWYRKIGTGAGQWVLGNSNTWYGTDRSGSVWTVTAPDSNFDMDDASFVDLVDYIHS